MAGYAACVTKRLGLLIAHRPGFTTPTLAARQLATLDVFTRGRVALHVISACRRSIYQARIDRRQRRFAVLRPPTARFLIERDTLVVHDCLRIKQQPAQQRRLVVISPTPDVGRLKAGE